MKERNGSIHQTCPNVFYEFEKIHEITRRASLMKYIFNKIVNIHDLFLIPKSN